MSIPTPKELGELVYGVMRDASGSIPFAPGLNALTELIGISVRDAVLNGLIAECEERADTAVDLGTLTVADGWAMAARMLRAKRAEVQP